ncbi:sensor histidine kinase [Streptomyces sp. A012304]|uniref:sensor histidine kinase n=1 Tax=Streptomyces sp. A012304 TaxID=375446 RepID=UPI0022315D01|nr:sensor histidine kinase [Streptomyces sp. A012304]GKQ34142.1 two-component sensor histidine kinase [Streptomyces sp. A012304]
MVRSRGGPRRALACHWRQWRAGVRQAREYQRAYQANKERFKEEYRAAQAAGRLPEHMGPPPTGFSLLPWLLLGMGAFSDLFGGRAPDPWIGALGLLTFNSLYIYVAFHSFSKRHREASPTRVALGLMALVTCGLAGAYGGNWVLFFPLLGLATGAALRGRHLRVAGAAVAVLAGTVSYVHEGWSGLDTAYATWISTMVTAAILSLSEAVRDLRAAREELARQAVEKERLRFSRDLHDLLGHTLSVIVVKAEAARRLAPRDMDAALAQITDVESVGRQALTEIREAVTGYREGSLDTELGRARSALTAAGVEPVVGRSGPPLEPQTAALLGWVVREAVTNVVRHSDATHCEITVSNAAERVRLTIKDNGTSASAGGAEEGLPTGGAQRTRPAGAGVSAGGAEGGLSAGGVEGARPTGAGVSIGGAGCGTGLTGLRERLAAVGGSLTAGPDPRGGFSVTAELPTEATGTPHDGVPPASAPRPSQDLPVPRDSITAPAEAPADPAGGSASADVPPSPATGDAPASAAVSGVSGGRGSTLGP